jgi:hypothetical protein
MRSRVNGEGLGVVGCRRRDRIEEGQLFLDPETNQHGFTTWMATPVTGGGKFIYRGIPAPR